MSKTNLLNKNFKWTLELAYVVGLLFTDVNMSKDGRHMAIKSSDLQLLKTFKTCLNISNKIKRSKNNGWAKKPIYVIQFGNVQLYRWLLKIGLFPAKTYTIGEIKIPDKYFRDFLRGHLDGDGCILTYRDFWNTFKDPKYIYTRLWIRFYSASEKHILWLKKKINKLLNIEGHLWERDTQRPDQNTKMWEIRFAKKESIKLINQIYYKDNLPCLERKRRIALKTLKKISKEKRRKYVKKQKSKIIFSVV